MVKVVRNGGRFSIHKLKCKMQNEEEETEFGEEFKHQKMGDFAKDTF